MVCDRRTRSAAALIVSAGDSVAESNYFSRFEVAIWQEYGAYVRVEANTKLAAIDKVRDIEDGLNIFEEHPNVRMTHADGDVQEMK